MRFIHDYNHFAVLHSTHDLDLLVQKVAGSSALKHRLAAKLDQQIVVEAAGCQLGISDIQDHKFLFRKFGLQAAERAGLACTGFADQDSKELLFGSIFQPAEYLCALMCLM